MRRVWRRAAAGILGLALLLVSPGVALCCAVMAAPVARDHACCEPASGLKAAAADCCSASSAKARVVAAGPVVPSLPPAAIAGGAPLLTRVVAVGPAAPSLPPPLAILRI